MTILHVIESFAAGGIETTFLNMLWTFRALAPRVRHEVLAFGTGPLEEAYRQAGDHVMIVPDWQAAAACRSRAADVIHVLFDRCAYRLIPELVARDPVPIVYGKGYDLAAMYRANEGVRWNADESLLVASTAATFTTRSLASQYSVPAGHSTVLGKAAAVKRFEQLPLPGIAMPPRILCVANLHARKRIGDLVDALALVRARVPAATLRLVGGGDVAAHAALIERARTAGVADALTFAGHVSDVVPEMARARVAALPSSCEGVPTVLLEAMAAGRPVVSTRSGHIESIITDGIEGFLVPVGDVTGLADRLIRILSEPALAARMSEAARRRAVRHDVGRVAQTLLDTLVAAAPVRPLAAAERQPQAELR
jgi:glycosyltransferase involved in cell wall biosynthesis